MIQTLALISKELSLVLAKVLRTARNIWCHLHYELCPSDCLKDINKMSWGHSGVGTNGTGSKAKSTVKT